MLSDIRFTRSAEALQTLYRENIFYVFMLLIYGTENVSFMYG
jgi:hypothetical protein